VVSDIVGLQFGSCPAAISQRITADAHRRAPYVRQSAGLSAHQDLLPHAPDATFELCDGTKDDLLTKLADHRLDAVIGRIDGPDSRFASSTLFKEKFILAVATNHRFVRENAVKLGDIDGEPFVARTGCEIYEQTTKLLADQEINLRFAYKTDQDYRALSLVSAGIGIAIIPELFDAAGISKVDIADFDFSRNMGLYWNLNAENEYLEKFLLVASAHDWRSRAL
jgi:DNA-binding transcriptional LysR family regulator